MGHQLRGFTIAPPVVGDRARERARSPTVVETHGEQQPAVLQGDAGSDELLGEEGPADIGTYLAADQYDAAYRHLEGTGYPQIRGIDRNGRFDYFESDAQLGLTLELLGMPEVYGTRGTSTDRPPVPVGPGCPFAAADRHVGAVGGTVRRRDAHLSPYLTATQTVSRATPPNP